MRAALAAGALVALAFAARAGRPATHWDEVQLALGVMAFDLTRHHPHPPGSPLFVLLARPLAWLTGDALLALRLLSAAALGAWVTLVVQRLPEFRYIVSRYCLVAAVAAFPLCSPLLGALGGSGLAYAPEGVIWTALALGRPGPGWGLLAGLAGGIRPTLGVWAGLWAWRAPGAWPGLVAGSLAWVALLMALSGGPGAWLEASAGVLSNIAARDVLELDAPGWRGRLALPGHLALATGPLLLLLPSLRRAGGPGEGLPRAAALAAGFYAIVIYDTAAYLAAAACALGAWLLMRAARWAGDRLDRALATLALVLAGALLPSAWLFDRATPPPGPRHVLMMQELMRQAEPGVLLVNTAPSWRLGMRQAGWEAPEAFVLQAEIDPAFGVTRVDTPYLLMHRHVLQARGPDGATLRELVPEARGPARVFGPAGDHLDPACGLPAEGLLLGAALPPGARLEAGRVTCPTSVP